MLKTQITDGLGRGYKAEVMEDKSLRTTVCGLRDEVGNYVTIDTDGYIRQKGFGSVKFAELFETNTMDTVNRWTENIAGAATKAIANSILTLTTTAGATDSITETSIQKITPVASQSRTRIAMSVNLGFINPNNNIREFGTLDSGNGFFFRVNNLGAFVVASNAGVEVSVRVENHLDNRFHLYEIVRSGLTSADFFINSEYVQSLKTAGDVPITGGKYDIIHLRNYNTAASTANTLKVSSCAIIDTTSQSVILAGKDSTGSIKDVQVDTTGRLVTTGPISQGVTNVLNWDLASRAPLAATIWERVLTYTIPTNQTFNLIQFQSAAGNTTQISRCVKQITFGSFNVSTNVFTDGSAFAPTGNEFSSRLYALVSTVLSATPTNVTVTYTNQDGTVGRTTSALTIPASAPATTMYEFILQTGDFGVRDVTAVSDTASPTGIISIIGIDELSYHRNKTADVVFESIAGGSAIVVNSGIGGIIGLDFQATNTNVARLMKALYTLYPTSI